VLTLILRMRADGQRLVDICEVLNAEGIPTPGGSAVWKPYHITRLLQTKTAVDFAAMGGW
jgi:hypothetical protein